LQLQPDGKVRRFPGGRGAVTAGFFDPLHPPTVAVLHDAGRMYWESLPARRRQALALQLRRRGLAVLIGAGKGAAESSPGAAAGITCFSTPCPAHEAVYVLRRVLVELQMVRTTVHGVLLRVHGMGVLLTGPSAVGKSEVALELIARGHPLVADDAVEIQRPAAGVLLGLCPPLLQGYLEVRGLGVLDVRRMYGARAVRERQRVDLEVRLAPAGDVPPAELRLGGRRSVRRLLGEALPVRTLAARLGDNRAVLVEAACLDQVLRQSGQKADATFAARQLEAIRRNTP
jgi:HPr kinase/phosphorylase